MTLHVFQNHLVLAAVLAAGVLLAPAMAQAQDRERSARYDGLDRRTCRDYTRTIFEFGRIRETYGTACLQRDGSWRVVAEGPHPAYRGDHGRVRFIPGYRYPGSFQHKDDRRESPHRRAAPHD